jgi:hypothetical protein
LDDPKNWPKGLTQPEVDDLRAHRIKIHLNRETTEKFMLGGYPLGYLEAKRSRSWAVRLGFSVNEPIIYSADFQVTTAAQQMLIDGFNDGAAEWDGRANVGNYGQYSVVKQALKRGFTGPMWQIMNSWSNGQKHPDAYAYQLIGGVSVGGVDCDRNELNPNRKRETITVSQIPDTIAKRWPSLAQEFPPNGTFDSDTALIWSDAAARYAAAQSDVILAAVQKIPVVYGSPAPIAITDSDVERIAQRVAEILGSKLSA